MNLIGGSVDRIQLDLLTSTPTIGIANVLLVFYGVIKWR